MYMHIYIYIFYTHPNAQQLALNYSQSRVDSELTKYLELASMSEHPQSSGALGYRCSCVACVN